ncbi:hypothetical protein Aduo_017679 [Ancylostoma duodenale]
MVSCGLSQWAVTERERNPANKSSRDCNQRVTKSRSYAVYTFWDFENTFEKHVGYETPPSTPPPPPPPPPQSSSVACDTRVVV